MSPPRVWGGLLLLLGTTALLVTPGLQPRWGEPGLVALDSPTVANFDASNNTTLVTPRCYYCSQNPTGYIVQGDLRGFQHRALYLGSQDASAWTVLDVGPSSGAAGRYVQQAYAGPFSVEVAWPRIATAFLAPVLVALGISLLPRSPDVARVAVFGTFAIAGTSLGLYGATKGDGGVIVVLFLPLFGVIVAILLGISKRTRRYAPAALLAIAAGLWALFECAAFFPAPPAI